VSWFCKVFISLGVCLLLAQPADIKGDTWLSKCLSIAMSVPDILSDTSNCNIFLAHVWQTVQTFIVHVNHSDPQHLGITVPIGLVLGVCYLTCFSYWFSVGPGSSVEFSMQCMVRILISYYWSLLRSLHCTSCDVKFHLLFQASLQAQWLIILL
jgi:hypothetical protein